MSSPSMVTTIQMSCNLQRCLVMNSLDDHVYLSEGSEPCGLLCEARSAWAYNVYPYLLTIRFYQLMDRMPDKTSVGEALDNFLSRHHYVKWW